MSIGVRQYDQYHSINVCIQCILTIVSLFNLSISTYTGIVYLVPRISVWWCQIGAVQLCLIAVAKVIHVSGADLVKDKLANCVGVNILNCGHSIYMDEPKTLAQLIQDFAVAMT